jgi:hypothetical protein
MVWIIIEEMEFVWLAIQTQIGQDVSVIGKALQGVSLDWDNSCVLVQSEEEVSGFEFSRG